MIPDQYYADLGKALLMMGAGLMGYLIFTGIATCYYGPPLQIKNINVKVK